MRRDPDHDDSREHRQYLIASIHHHQIYNNSVIRPFLVNHRATLKAVSYPDMCISDSVMWGSG